MKRILLISLFYLPFVITGQIFNKKYFTDTQWFSNNRDSIFFKSDTLRLIKYSNFGPKEGNPQFSNEYAENESNYLGHGAYIVLKLGKNRKWDFTQTYPGSSKRTGLAGPLAWHYDKFGVLNLYDLEKKWRFAFKPLSERKVKIDSRFSGQSQLQTSELTIIRIK